MDRAVPFSDEALKELGRVLSDSPTGDMYAWLDTSTSDVLIATQLYGFDPDGAPDDDEDTNVVALPDPAARDLPDWMQQERALVQEMCADVSGRYRYIPIGMGCREGNLGRFARTLTDPVLQDQVRDAMRGRGAYRRVKDLLHRRGRIELWYEFEAERQRDVALEWLEEVGITAVPAPGASWRPRPTFDYDLDGEE